MRIGVRKLLVSLGFALWLALPRANAEIGVIDAVPAATLLLPYFQVDLDDPLGPTTLATISNASAQPTLVHVTFWTDWAIPTLSFNLYLGAFDGVSLNLRDMFNGVVPDTTPTGGVGFPGCVGQFPPGTLPPSNLQLLTTAHTGQSVPIFAGQCAGTDYGDRVARGYVTFDVANVCTLQYPGDAGYFVDGGTGEASNNNVLWGEYQFVDRQNNFASGDTLVHVEADASLNSDYTFYGRFGSAADNRETLASKWAAPFRSVPEESGGTTLMVWRDPKREVTPQVCGAGLPLPYPFSQESIAIFDTESNPGVPPAPPDPPDPLNPPDPPPLILPFPFATNFVDLGQTGLYGADERAGWLYLNLNTTVLGGLFDFRTQSHVTVIEYSQGRFSSGGSAVQLQNARTDQGSLPIQAAANRGAPQ